MLHMGNAYVGGMMGVVWLRILHGCFSSAFDPLSFALVADYYNKEDRTRVNSILSSGTFLGIALASMSILLIKMLGWRGGYFYSGLLGLVLGALALVFMPRATLNDGQKITDNDTNEEDEGSS